jgi:cytoskeletal protein RodZ
MSTNTTIVKKRKVLPASEMEKVSNNDTRNLDKKAASVGDKLRMLREEQAKSIQDVARALRIGEHYLLAIENMERHALPERVYALGFVRSYSHYLGLDPQSSIDQFKEEIYGNYQAELFSLPEPLSEASQANWKVLLICVGIIGIIIFSWYKFIQKKRPREPENTGLALKEVVEERAPSNSTRLDSEKTMPFDNRNPLEKSPPAFLELNQLSKGQFPKDFNISLANDLQQMSPKNTEDGSFEKKAPKEEEE